MSRSIFLAEPFNRAWKNKDVFVEVSAISKSAPANNLYRAKEGRRTLRFTLNNQSFFLKHHLGVGWKEIIKNILQLRAPVLGAENEYLAANTLKSLNVDTLTPVAYGRRGKNPATQESFLITEDLVDTISLEDFCKDWPAKPPSFRIKNALIKKVAHTAKIMHDSGINHRDFYICHFLLEKYAEQKIRNNENFFCYLIDLHRCQFRNHVPYRWLIKDLGGLLYSTMDIGLSARDYFRFIKIYTGKSLHESLRDAVWLNVLATAEKLYQKDFKKAPRVIFRAPK